MGCGGTKSVQIIESFPWGAKGSVKIRTIRYKAVYNQDTKQIEVQQPANRVTESILHWSSRNFSLRDLTVLDIDTNSQYDLPQVTLSFMVTQGDQFQSITNPDNISDQISQITGATLTPNQKKIFLDKLKREARELWKYMRGNWLGQQAQRTQVEHGGRDCYNYFKEYTSDFNRAKLYLERQFQAKNIKRALKLVKGLAIVDKDKERPHLLKIRRTCYATMDINGEQVNDLLEEIRVVIFLWPDIEFLNGNQIIQQQIDDMQQGIKILMSDFQEEVSKEF